VRIHWQAQILGHLFCSCVGKGGWHEATASSWTDIRKAIPSSGAVTMTLAPSFTCDYDSQITVSAGTNVTIHGNGATLDAAQKGRFFEVPSGAALSLDHMVLQTGFVSGGSVSGLAYGITRPQSTDHHARMYNSSS
jgi:hypothetical protein